MADIPSLSATEGDNPTPAQGPGPDVGLEGSLPNLHPTPEDVAPQVTEVDWPPATPQGPSDPPDTPGWKDVDELFPATEPELEGPDA